MAPTPSSNRFIRALSTANRKAFLADCSTLELAFSDLLCEAFDQHSYVYFPMSAYISQLSPQVGEDKIEVGMIGDEGMVGATLLLGVSEAPQQAVVQGAGTTLRMETSRFLKHVSTNPKLDALLKNYLFVQIVQLNHATACTRYHTVQARLARWLLMIQDRAHRPDFRMTHEYLATMLGVRRVGVTQAAVELQRRGLITYQRGEIVVINRAELEKAACACYRADCRIYEKMMG